MLFRSSSMVGKNAKGSDTAPEEACDCQKHSDEAICETAEREVFEEIGYQVRAVEKLSLNVFKCEVIAENVCTSPVDQDFLKRTWAVKENLHGLQHRSGTWADKKSFLSVAWRCSVA